MTAAPKGTLKWCGDCYNFNAVVGDTIGVCTEIKSDHNRHILEASHPGCSLWWMRT